MERIAIDLTPLLPGAENGGAKKVATQLVQSLSRLRQDCRFTLLTSSWSHGELSFLDAPNVRRLCMQDPGRSIAPFSSVPGSRVRHLLRRWASSSIPPALRSAAKRALRFLLAHRRLRSGVVRQLGVDLLFCPFTMPFYYDSTVPVVSIIYDLQYRYYPQFFKSEDLLSREENFRITCRLADRLICISEYVRQTVLEDAHLPGDRVTAIPIRLFTTLKKPGRETILASLRKHALGEDEFFFYPANFWPHKNHAMLFTAFGMWRARHPSSRLRLLCTGAPDERMASLRDAAWRMGLAEWIRLPGFLAEEEFSALLASCQALIFPSLYEGFGMPVLEAMSFGKPVLCSNVTSLPEVAGDAAYYLDPKKPEEILTAMQRINVDPQLRADLVKRGYQRAAAFGDADQMAREYLSVFEETLKGRGGTCQASPMNGRS